MWLDFVYIVKVELLGFVDGLDVGEREKGIKEDFKDFDLSNWIEGVVIYWDLKDCKRKLGVRIGYVKFEMFIWYL